jgi:hypothetical protein
LAVALAGILANLAWAEMPASSDRGAALSPLASIYNSVDTSVSITLTPGVAASLTYTDPQGLPTRLDFPAGAAVVTTTITFMPDLLTSPRPDFIPSGHAFDLLASRDNALDKSFAFNALVTVTVHYSDTDVPVTSERFLSLYWWSGNDWRDAAQTCALPQSYTRDEIGNVIGVGVCEIGQFGLFASYRLYLPYISRAAP